MPDNIVVSSSPSITIYRSQYYLFFIGIDSHQEDCQEERFPPYLWQPGQPPAPQPQPQPPAPNSPSASLSSSQGDAEEDEALPSSLSGMARHFQAQRAARAHRREADHLPPKLSRYSELPVPVGNNNPSSVVSQAHHDWSCWRPSHWAGCRWKGNTGKVM